MRVFVSWVLVLLLATCSTTADQVLNSDAHVYWVNSSKVDCQGAGPRTCLLVKRDRPLNKGDWEYFYANIEGFDFEPGYLYKLKVRETSRLGEEVPADASSLRYTLERVLEKNPDPSLQLNDIWVLEAIGEEELSFSDAQAGAQRPTIEFHLAERRVMGSDGCNTFTGPLQRATADSLRFGPLVTTRMACPGTDNPDRVERALAEVAAYSRSGLRLRLLDRSGTSLLTYRKVD